MSPCVPSADAVMTDMPDLSSQRTKNWAVNRLRWFKALPLTPLALGAAVCASNGMAPDQEKCGLS